MYRIIKLCDGRYLVECTIQDGTERSYSSSWEEAVTELKRAAKAWNGTKIKKRDIKFFREELVQARKFVEIQKPI